MSTLESNLEMQELTGNELQEINGGFLPIPVMLGIWGVQAALCAAGIGALATVAAAE
ncbi:class IIb bacteriocin, lactobin A/cerein 7B family [Olivibacter sp. SDN3]|uniref:class IIb bacteriocin, lactobin A/cerein 7B family n=1 Tax=Olivibacter sp. SDN3 TaxID=2764720 RepID=UPI0016510EBE|nr:class IIb bacteriocin, lactobin A/cerein 7B family [Olivibacter sp. SDN3]QNL48169.1 class IIb bacteriocin, lactobin A/cerein 7B family [Olivibacter sp. SDN3]